LQLEGKRIREEKLGVENTDYASSLNSLGNLNRKLGNYEMAERMFEQVLSIYEKILGKENPRYAETLNNLAVVCKEKGNYEKAEFLYLQAKDVFEKSVGKDHLSYAGILNGIAVFCYFFPLLLRSCNVVIRYNLSLELLLINFTIILYLMFGLLIYLSLKFRTFTNPLNGFFALGDLLFLLVIIPFFNPNTFLFFFTTGTCFVLLVHLSLMLLKKAKKEMAQGVAFLSLMRNLTSTGFYTSEIGVKDIGYMGNVPNQWNGVPDDVLKQYGVAYTEKELKECVSFNK